MEISGVMDRQTNRETFATRRHVACPTEDTTIV